MKIVIGPSTDMNVLDIAVAAKAYDFSVVEVRVLVKLRLLLVAVCALFCCFSLGFWHVCVCVPVRIHTICWEKLRHSSKLVVISGLGQDSWCVGSVALSNAPCGPEFEQFEHAI